ncbi:MAG: HD domain-containing protein [Chitinivibrionales bacterium]|nr:HD domain-containing protein [Chitinivibrionales bacterium]MBD3396667.1 HD domain-containing protein [Chitinivibrionales bacterium]
MGGIVVVPNRCRHPCVRPESAAVFPLPCYFLSSRAPKTFTQKAKIPLPGPSIRPVWGRIVFWNSTFPPATGRRKRMVRYNIDDVTDDMVLGESIFMPTGELLLAAGFKLTERYRLRLKQMGFHTVGIQVEGTEDVTPEKIISDHVQAEMAVSVSKTTDAVRNVLRVRKEGVQNLRKMIRENKTQLNKYLASSGLARTLEKLIDEILNNPTVVLNMSALQNVKADLFSHAINVTTIALCIGRKYHFSYDELKQLAMGAINFDIGLVALPAELHERNGELSPEEFKQYQQHTVYGYLMLSQNPSIAPTSAAVALQHHEYQDGTGFPRGMKGENRPPLKDFSRKKVIHRFAEIVAVADTYDMLLTGRMGVTLDTYHGVRRVIEMGGTKLNADIVKTFASIVPVYPVGARLRITDAPASQLVGYYGVVARDNPDDLEKPQIVLYETRKRLRIPPILIDLAKRDGVAFEILT